MTTVTNTANARQIGLADVAKVEHSDRLSIEEKISTLQTFIDFYEQEDVTDEAKAALRRLQKAER